MHSAKLEKEKGEKINHHDIIKKNEIFFNQIV